MWGGGGIWTRSNCWGSRGFIHKLDPTPGAKQVSTTEPPLEEAELPRQRLLLQGRLLPPLEAPLITAAYLQNASKNKDQVTTLLGQSIFPSAAKPGSPDPTSPRPHQPSIRTAGLQPAEGARLPTQAAHLAHCKGGAPRAAYLAGPLCVGGGSPRGEAVLPPGRELGCNGKGDPANGRRVTFLPGFPAGTHPGGCRKPR